MSTTQDVIWAMNIRAHHNEEHSVPMEECSAPCRTANDIIQEDNERKKKGS